jgi:hypothetical protein
MRFFPTIFSRIYRLGAPPPLSPQQLWGTSKSKFFAGLFYSDPAAALIKPFCYTNMRENFQIFNPVECEPP